MDGEQLHGMGSKGGGVPIKSWCVTRQDLVFLRTELRSAIATGLISPTERDGFDPADDVIGPNMYTVCEQYIKPLTKGAGSMSWALLRNPKGLECDLFITHAWIEGIFEFIDKVLISWPAGKRACYACMLSNPQNLDIAELIKTPRTSPFALCLDSATHMLVTPNHHSSIYSRLWCVYEAWLACEKDKVILTATPYRHGRLIKAMLLLLLPLGVGLALGLAWISDDCPDMKMALQYGLFLVIFTKLLGLFRCLRSIFQRVSGQGSRFLRWYPAWFACDVAGAFWSGVTLASDIKSWGNTCEQQWAAVAFRWCGIVLASYFLASEVERVRAIFNAEEARQLRNSFTSVGAAQCSNRQDEHTIRAEIGQAMIEVDRAVSVLLHAGMSTPALRAAASSGASVDGAGHLGATSVVTCVGLWILLHCLFFSAVEDGDEAMSAMWVLLNVLVVAVYSALLYTRRALEERAFIASVTGKMCSLALTFLFLTISPEAGRSGVATNALGMLFLCGGPALLFSLLGLARTARLPGCGPLLASLLGPSSSCRRFRLLSDSSGADGGRWADPVGKDTA